MAEPNEVDQLLDQLLKGKSPEEIPGRDGVLKGLTKRLVEQALVRFGAQSTASSVTRCVGRWRRFVRLGGAA